MHVFSSTADFSGSGKKHWIRASSSHLSIMLVDKRFQHWNRATLLYFPQHLYDFTPHHPAHAHTLKRYKHVGILARRLNVQSQTTAPWRWLIVRHYSTTCSNRTATAAGLSPCGFNICFICCCVQLVLVDPLEALSVLYSHEEFLSQVLEWFVAGQIQAVETGKQKLNDGLTKTLQESGGTGEQCLMGTYHVWALGNLSGVPHCSIVNSWGPLEPDTQETQLRCHCWDDCHRTTNCVTNDSIFLKNKLVFRHLSIFPYSIATHDWIQYWLQ